MLDNFINGNIKEARKQARRYNSFRVQMALISGYGFSPDKALKTARFLKTGEGLQQAFDAL